MLTIGERSSDATRACVLRKIFQSAWPGDRKRVTGAIRRSSGQRRLRANVKRGRRGTQSCRMSRVRQTRGQASCWSRSSVTCKRPQRDPILSYVVSATNAQTSFMLVSEQCHVFACVIRRCAGVRTHCPWRHTQPLRTLVSGARQPPREKINENRRVKLCCVETIYFSRRPQTSAC